MQNIHNKALIYIQPDSSDNYNNIISEHYIFIKTILDSVDISFIYFPELLKDDHFNRVMDYNYPFIKEFQQTDITPLYNQLVKELDIEITQPGLVYLTEHSKKETYFELPAPEQFNTDEEIVLFLFKIIEEIKGIKTDSDIIMFSIGDGDNWGSKFKQGIIDVSKEYSTDDNFETEAFEISDELQDQILELQESGHLSFLIDYLQKIHEASRKLSRLMITGEYKIFLIDYDMKEVVMSPLPKALYLLFLRHSKGIMLKDMRDYYDELLEIYQNISLRENMDDIRDSIDKITNPTDNSFNEKCSRIRQAFIKVITEDLAKNYYITGKRGKPKRVKLDRELVVYD